MIIGTAACSSFCPSHQSQEGMATPTDDSKDTSHHGSCHCKAILFDFLASQNVKISICNCSICTMKGFPPSLNELNSGFEHLVVPKEKFTLITPWDAVKTYTFGTGIAQHYFCSTCGISPFYVPRSNPNGYSVCKMNSPLTIGQLSMCRS